MFKKKDLKIKSDFAICLQNTAMFLIEIYSHGLHLFSFFEHCFGVYIILLCFYMARTLLGIINAIACCLRYHLKSVSHFNVPNILNINDFKRMIYLYVFCFRIKILSIYSIYQWCFFCVFKYGCC